MLFAWVKFVAKKLLIVITLPILKRLDGILSELNLNIPFNPNLMLLLGTLLALKFGILNSPYSQSRIGRVHPDVCINLS